MNRVHRHIHLAGGIYRGRFTLAGCCGGCTNIVRRALSNTAVTAGVGVDSSTSSSAAAQGQTRGAAAGEGVLSSTASTSTSISISRRSSRSSSATPATTTTTTTTSAGAGVDVDSEALFIVEAEPQAIKKGEGRKIGIPTTTSATTPTTTSTTTTTTTKEKLDMASRKNNQQQQQGSGGPYLPYANLISLRKLPYTCKTLNRTQQLLIAPFFDAVPFFTKEGNACWDVREDTDVNGKPVLLIPLKQAWAFLDMVETETGVEVPKHPMGLYAYKEAQSVDGAKAAPKKRKLVGSKDEWEGLLEECKNRGMLTGASGGPKTKEEKDARKAAAAEKAVKARSHGFVQLAEARGLLGLPQDDADVVEVKMDSAAVLEDKEDGGVKLVESSASTTTITTKAIEVPSQKPAYFVCIDIESWERDHSLVTEIGISTLDTTPLLPTFGTNTYATVLPHMKYRHIRITEHKNLRNGRYVNDNADRFDFGKTEFHPLASIPRILAEIFAAPTPDHHVCFVAHDAPTDLKYLTSAFKFNARENVPKLKVFDTAELYKTIVGAKDTMALGKMLLSLKLEPWNLHNAGNDAAFTLRSFVKICGRDPEIVALGESVSRA
ncbi:hypothetical protein DFH27DRAFT_307447 [Peziza echinospora]|nr:hypothetical protein DFH27DRAFT_307447 [Peziza echinospora]